MKKKGFTVIEVVVILLVLIVVGLIFFLGITKIFSKVKDNAFKS